MENYQAHYEDENWLPPVDYDESKVPPEIKFRSKGVREASWGWQNKEFLAQGLEIAGIVSDESKKLVEENKVRQDAVEDFNTQVVQEMTDKDVISAPEIIQSRKGEANLNARLDKEHNALSAQLAQKADKSEVSAQLAQTNNNLKDKYDGSGKGIFVMNIMVEDFKKIKDLGCSYIHWVCYSTDINFIIDRLELCKENGLNVLLSLKDRFQKNDDATALSIISATKNMENIIGYYVLDEPEISGNNVTIDRQNEIIDMVRQITSLPISISTTGLYNRYRISPNFDFYYISSYAKRDEYLNIISGNSTMFSVYGEKLLHAGGLVGMDKCIPILGYFRGALGHDIDDYEFLFNFQKEVLESYPTQGYAMYIWDFGPENMKNSTELYNQALRVSKDSGQYSKGNLVVNFSGRDEIGRYPFNSRDRFDKLLSYVSPFSKNITFGDNPTGNTTTGIYFVEGSSLVFDFGKIVENVYVYLSTLVTTQQVNIEWKAYAGLSEYATEINIGDAPTFEGAYRLRGVNIRYMRIEVEGLEGTETNYEGNVILRDIGFVAK